MKFEDRHEYNGHTHYPVCNEHIGQWKDTLEGVQVKRAAGICSGGEVSFFAITPRVTEEIVLVDHSYCSLWAALGKYRTVEKLGAKKAREMLTRRIQASRRIEIYYDSYHKRWEVYDPNTGRVTHQKEKPEIKEPDDELWQIFAEANKGKKTHDVWVRSYMHRWPLPNMAHAWRGIDDEDVAAFRRNRAKVRIIHGDLSDLVGEGQFDLVYLSNALAYSGRNGRAFELDKYVKPGGLVAFATSKVFPRRSTYYNPNTGRYERAKEPDDQTYLLPTELLGYEVLKVVRPIDYSTSWTHVLAKRPEKEVSA